MGLFDWVQTGIQWLQANWTQAVDGSEESPPPLPTRRVILISRRKGPPPDWRRFRKPMDPRDAEILVEEGVPIQPRVRSLVFIEVETDIFAWLPPRPRYKVLGLTASPFPSSRVTAQVVCRQPEFSVDGDVEVYGARVSSLDIFLRVPVIQLDQEVSWLSYGIVANGPSPQPTRFLPLVEAETDDAEALAILMHVLTTGIPTVDTEIGDEEVLAILQPVFDEEVALAIVNPLEGITFS